MRGATLTFPPTAFTVTYFNPRAPCGARPLGYSAALSTFSFQSTRPVRGATKSGSPPCYTDSISIHAPRAGRDASHRQNLRQSVNFNPRAPCGARLRQSVRIYPSSTFQSTRPVRGATRFLMSVNKFHVISIHAPRAGRDFLVSSSSSSSSSISIHAPRAGRDDMIFINKVSRMKFQSTRPVRGATTATSFPIRMYKNFNPRAPCGARPFQYRKNSPRSLFQSTRPVRGATWDKIAYEVYGDISIHAPRAGRDARFITATATPKNFNPRAPCGARPHGSGRETRTEKISIHAPRAGRDAGDAGRSVDRSNFNPRAPCGARQPPPWGSA